MSNDQSMPPFTMIGNDELLDLYAWLVEEEGDQETYNKLVLAVVHAHTHPEFYEALSTREKRECRELYDSMLTQSLAYQAQKSGHSQGGSKSGITRKLQGALKLIRKDKLSPSEKKRLDEYVKVLKHPDNAKRLSEVPEVEEYCKRTTSEPLPNHFGSSYEVVVNSNELNELTNNVEQGTRNSERGTPNPEPRTSNGDARTHARTHEGKNSAKASHKPEPSKYVKKVLEEIGQSFQDATLLTIKYDESLGMYVNDYGQPLDDYELKSAVSGRR